MRSRTLLWVDFPVNRLGPDLCGSLPRAYAVQRLVDSSNIFSAIDSLRPWAVCFEYDRPDAKSLGILERVKARFNSLPVMMLTGCDSKPLSQWAARTCVWDYLVKPCTIRAICDSLRSLGQLPVAAFPEEQNDSCEATEIKQSHSPPGHAAKVAPALSYIQTNYAQRIRMATAAHLCELSPFQFSRMFKKVNGLTFQDYVVQLRIQRAAELMKQNRSSVTDAAFGVGFNDLSYFARVFRKQLGVAPSQYRSHQGVLGTSLLPERR